jgi:tetrahydromethanopterin S-methyltransferase subunit H
MTFADRMKTLKAEIEALKTVKRKSSLTLATVTKSATCVAQLYRTEAGAVICQYSGLIEITPRDGTNEPLIGYSQPSYSARGTRDVRLTPWVTADGKLGILCTPEANSAENNMATGSTKDIQITVYITATDDFTTASGQVRSN